VDRRQLGERRALVTGGASGLGRAVAQRLASDGWRVAIADIDPAAAERSRAEIAGEAMALRLDVRSEDEWVATVARLDKAWGGVDLLVNSAGVASSGTVEQTPIAQWQWVLDINLMGTVKGCRAVIPGMKARGVGYLANVASFAGIANPPSMASYNAAKAAVISLSETLRQELHADGIGVSVACPAFIKTPLMESSRRLAPTGSPTTAQDSRMEAIVRHLMETSGVTAADFAEDLYEAIRRGRFLVIVHRDARWRALAKRLAPELFFREVRRTTAKFLKR
jgi:NAD(P)-dependent dehydrogenase (short-subunit alcohol dehydrogenase family)